MFSLDLLRALAILLITNSHLDSLYPNAMFGTGGMFGNELFFFISGFGLALSKSGGKLPFAAWMSKRLRRVIEPLFIATVLMLAIGYFHLSQVADLTIFAQIFRTYWFLPTIIVFYIPLFLVMRARTERLAFFIAAFVALVCYVAAYLTVVDYSRFSVEGPVAAKAPFYFVVMLAGVYASRHWREIKGGGIDVVVLFFATLAYLVFQYAMRRFSLFTYQFIIHLIGFTWLIAMYRCSRLPLIDRIRQTRLRPAVTFLSSVSLWIYLLQEAIIQSHFIQSLSFPLGVILFWVLVLPSAWLFNRINIEKTIDYFIALRERREA